MARTAYTTTKPTTAGVNTGMVTADSANGMSLPWTTHALVRVKNAAGTSMTVTIRTHVTTGDGLVLPDRTVTVPATTGDMYIGPFDPNIYKQADGNVYVDFSTATSVTTEAIQVSST